MAKAGKKEKKSMAWGWIIFWFILFWPLGMLFLLGKISKDKATIMKDSNKVTIMSFVLVGIGVFIFSRVLNTGGTYNYLWALSLIGGGVWTFFKARKMKIDGERYKKYISIVINQSQTSIDNIASAVGIPYDAAVKDLQKMIDTGYFTGAYIDVTQREIVLAKTVQVKESTSKEADSLPPSAVQVQERIVACSSCGANNKVKGHVGECEYCGSHLQ
ncbi:MAG: hypothetical protein FWH17_03725 [Oscillospiraceae bacterium]|nr:hypothetical protein [Oscillospiraceae bacterium]